METYKFPEDTTGWELTPPAQEILDIIKSSSCAPEYYALKETLSSCDLVKPERQDWWIANANQFFGGSSPADLILEGRGRYVRDAVRAFADGVYF